SATLRTALYTTSTAVLLGAAAYLAWNTRPTDDRARTEVAAQLQVLKELDARWDMAIVTAKDDPRQLEQTEANVVTSLQRALAELQRLSVSLRGPALDTNLQGLSSAIEDKIVLGSQVRAQARVLADTLEKALASATDAAATLRTEAAATTDPRRRERIASGVADLEHVSAELVAFWGASGDARRATVAAALARLVQTQSQAQTQTQAPLAVLRSNAQSLLDGKPRLESTITRFALSPAGPRLSALTTAFSAEVQTGLERQQLFRTYLLFYSAALLVLLAWIASRLFATYKVIASINAALQSANESLEQKVDLRTHELSSALADLKESEAQLIQSEKMSSLGQMVAGIAHEINTPIAYVKNSLGTVDHRLDGLTRLTGECEGLLAMLEAGDTPDAMLDLQLAQLSGAARALGGASGVGGLGALVKDGLYGVEQIGQIVNHLRDFSRLDRGEVQQFDLHQGIESTLLLARHLLKGIRVDKRFDTDGTLFGSSSQMNQVLLNLITNAAQAIGPDGGVITLATFGDRDTLVVEISDTGSGIAPEIVSKIFDPFFTTKAVGQGTGLGLSISYKIVTQHGGRIDVRSQPGRGTMFRLSLPRSGGTVVGVSSTGSTGARTDPVPDTTAPATP
ncbi:MAG: sensor histidine kinase, partial [Proteobacteria bacterium]|nr:sensor histidine kinase [Burkholderiales bacterium]